MYVRICVCVCVPARMYEGKCIAESRRFKEAKEEIHML